MSRKKNALKDIKNTVEDIRGTFEGLRSETKDITTSIRPMPVRRMMERRGPVRSFIEKRPKPLQDYMKKKEREE